MHLHSSKASAAKRCHTASSRNLKRSLMQPEGHNSTCEVHPQYVALNAIKSEIRNTFQTFQKKMSWKSRKSSLVWLLSRFSSFSSYRRSLDQNKVSEGFCLRFILMLSLILPIILPTQELFKVFKDIPQVPSGPMGWLRERGTDLFSYLTASQSNI